MKFDVASLYMGNFLLLNMSKDFFETVEKHQEHDQKTHGSWANALIGTQTLLGTTVTSLIDKLSEKNTPGFSIDLRTKTSPKDGFIASDSGAERALDWAKVSSSRVTLRNEIIDYVVDHAELLDSAGTFFGGWVEKGVLYLDVSRRYASRSEGIRVGFQNEQKAIYDVVNDSYIYMEDEVDERTNKARSSRSSQASQGNDTTGIRSLRRRDGRGPTGQEVDAPHICLGRYPNVEKHLDGQHDQSTHGSWASGRFGEDSLKSARDGAKEYAFKAGIEQDDSIDYQKTVANRARAARIADAYDELPVEDEKAFKAYGALATEVEAQFDYMTKTMGMKVEFVDDDPYKTSREMFADASKGSIKVLRTASTGSHPFFTDEQNDKFRAVHDFFGHAATGRGFGQDGEESAWVHHSQMFTMTARAALTTETRGQNSWYNTRNQGFAEQKVALLPEEFWQVPKTFEKSYKVIRFEPGLIPVLKHGTGDQKPHGSWANQGFSEQEAARIARMEDVGPSIEDLNSALDGGEQPDLDELKFMVENDFGLYSSAIEGIEERIAAAVEEAQSESQGQETSDAANEQLYNRLYEEIQNEMVDEYMEARDYGLVQIWMEQNGGGGDVESLTPAFDDVYRVEVTGTGRDGLEHTLTSQITSVRGGYEANEILVEGYVENEDGDSLSDIQRSFTRDSNGDWEAEHDYLMINNPDYRGTGFGKEFLRQSEDWYTAKGISSLVVGTADEGAVYWARRGFDFDEKSNTRNFQTLNNLFPRNNPEFISLMNRAVNGYDANNQSFDSVKPMNTPGFPTPAEFALIGYTKGATEWLASDAMSGAQLKYRKGMSAEGRSLITPSGTENPIDRDGDGFVFDGTSRERPAP